jgi:hypothetical protein
MLRYDPAKDAYALLGVHPEATQKEVEQAFRRAVLTWHPDKSPAPDATERFFEVQEAGRILRDTVTRSDYDRVRMWHLGPSARTTRRRSKPPERPPQPYTPLDPPPGWLADKVDVKLDSVRLRVTLPDTRPASGRVAGGLALVCLGIAIATQKMLIGALAAVLWLYSRLVATPPHKGRLVWAEMAPGRQSAMFHVYDTRAHTYAQLAVPYGNLAVVIVPDGSRYRVQISGFPNEAVPILHRTHDRTEAEKCAREARYWLHIRAA